MQTMMKKIGAWMGAFLVGSAASVAGAQTSAPDDSSKTPSRKVSPQDVQNMPMPEAKESGNRGKGKLDPKFKGERGDPQKQSIKFSSDPQKESIKMESIKMSSESFLKRGAEQKKDDPK